MVTTAQAKIQQTHQHTQSMSETDPAPHTTPTFAPTTVPPTPSIHGASAHGTLAVLGTQHTPPTASVHPPPPNIPPPPVFMNKFPIKPYNTLLPNSNSLHQSQTEKMFLYHHWIEASLGWTPWKKKQCSNSTMSYIQLVKCFRSLYSDYQSLHHWTTPLYLHI